MPTTELQLVKGSALAEATSLGDNDTILIVQAGVTKKITKQNLVTSLLQAFDGSKAITVNVTGSESITLAAGTFIAHMTFTGNSNVQVGTTEGGNDIVNDSVSTGTPLNHSLVKDPYFETQTTLHFTGTFTAILYLWYA